MISKQPLLRRSPSPSCFLCAGAILLWLGLLGASAGIFSTAPDPATVFGVAHVDGKYFLTTDDFLDEGADQILATGSKVIKLYLTPERYPWNSQWPTDIGSLVELAQAPYFKSVFAKPFTTYILTVYSVGRPDHYWTAGINTDQTADETRQFYELSKYLLTTYKGTGKNFVLQNWEGDWALRHDAPTPYDASYVPSLTAVNSMIQWFNARQAGILKARNELGLTDVHVYGAAEANRLEDSMAGKPGVANSVLPYTTVDLASYSCYNFLDTPERLAQGVDYLAAHLPITAIFGQNPHSIYLGEFGYPENGQGGLEALNRRIDNAVTIVNRKGLSWAIYWEIFCNEPLNKTLRLPLNGKENDRNLRGFWMIKPDGLPAMAWHRYRRIIATGDPRRATTKAIKLTLTQVFYDDFNRPDGRELGTGWAQASHYGVVNKQLQQHRLRFEVPDGHDIPWGSATLDLNNRAVLGHSLEVGDYFEVTARRLSEQGGLGVELFDSDQLRFGGDLQAGVSTLQTWNGTTWVPIAFDDHGQPVKFDWNSAHTLGVRFDSADGRHATFSYYLDGHYAGSWLITTAKKTLEKIGVYVQSKTAGAVFEFADLRVFASRGRLAGR